MKSDRRQLAAPPVSAADSNAFDIAYRLLARRDHTCQELALKLRNKGVSRPVVDQVLERCRTLGYLDDARTATVLAGHLVRRGYGPLYIRQALGQKGLAESVIAHALARCGDDRRQVQTARQVLEKKRSRLAREPEVWRRRQIAYRFLAGRGFTAEVINQVIDDLPPNSPDR